MEVIVDSMAWLPKEELKPRQIENLKSELTVWPEQVGEYAEEKKPIFLFSETDSELGIAREFFFAHKRAVHEVIDRTTVGEASVRIGNLSGKLRDEQQQAVDTIVDKLDGRYGGILCAPPGWGKTVAACALLSRLSVPSIVIVHKEFLMTQWKQRIEQYLPHAKIGVAQQNKFEYEGCSIVLGMVHSVASGKYPEEFYRYFGCLMVDECHRIGAYTWSPTPKLFRARYRIGLTATARRKDKADDVFWLHLGPTLFTAKSRRLVPSIKRVRTNFSLIRTDRFNPSLASRGLVINFLCANRFRNKAIVELIIEAVSKDRKLLVLSERLRHLDALHSMIEKNWPMRLGSLPDIGYYVGGMKDKERKRSEKASIILATTQYAQEGLDIPALDTLFLTTPISDVEQAVGRILRPCKGKKNPIVVDFRDDNVSLLKRSGRSRDRYYSRI